MKDEVPLGKLATETATRDAIHLAVAPVIAGERLAPGQRIGFLEDSHTHVRAGETVLGIVDPFLVDWVEEGQRFLMVLLPNTITGMHHEWTHPAFHETKRVVDVSGSELWIQKYCYEIGCRREEIMNAAERYLNRGDYWCEGGRWEGFYLHDDFWKHYEIVTGDAIPDSKRYSFFSCSC